MSEPLLVDLGNTRLSWAGPAELEAGLAEAVVHGGRVDEGLLERCWGERTVPERVVVGNVAGPVAAAAVSGWVRRRWGVEPRFLRAGSSAGGVTNGYRQPERLGIDRWAALVAAFQTGLLPACVIDAGSAITVDLLAEDGVHLGGYIVPGLPAMARALQGAAPALSVAAESGAGDDAAPGRDTEEAVAAGTRLAVAGLVERAMVVAAARFGQPPHCLLTGGDAGRLGAPSLEGCRQLPMLVLQGLGLLDAGERTRKEG